MSGHDELSLPVQLVLIACLCAALFGVSWAVTTWVA